jgi:hypothetical protein
MSWQALFKLSLGFTLIDQLIALVQRDQAAALEYVLANFPALPQGVTVVPVQFFFRGPGSKPQPPYIIVSVQGPDYDLNAEPPLKGTHAFTVICDCGDFDNEDVVWQAQVYALTLMQVLTASLYGPGPADLCQALTLTENDGTTTRTTVPPAAGTVTNCMVHAAKLEIQPGSDERPTPLMRVAINGSFDLNDFGAA